MPIKNCYACGCIIYEDEYSIVKFEGKKRVICDACPTEEDELLDLYFQQYAQSDTPSLGEPPWAYQ